MGTGAALIALGESFRDMASGVEVLDALENQFRIFGATHFLVAGLPLPGRPIEPLVLRMSWGELRPERAGAINSDDPLLQGVLSAGRPFEWSSDNASLARSALLAELGSPPVRLVGVPVAAFRPYQAVVLAAGEALVFDLRSLLTLDYMGAEAFRRLFALGYVQPERPGDLSPRERRVVELSALGKTANEIAVILEISQRTVHAHLQNASEKLRAHNKTQTVVEALRYGQISI